MISGKDRFLPRYAEIALSFGLGMGLLAQYMLFIGALNLTYNFYTMILPVLIITVVLFATKKRYGKISGGEAFQPKENSIIDYLREIGFTRSIIVIFSYVFIAILIFYSFYRALTLPVYSWDALATMVFKGKIIYYERTLEYLKNFPHPTYPLQVPFMISWISIFSGIWSDLNFKILFPLTLLSFVMFLYYFLRNYAGQLWALLGVLLLLSGNLLLMHSTIAYRDLTQMYYACMALMLLVLWDSKDNDLFLIMAALFSGFTTFIKLEGTAYLGILTCIFLLLLLQKRNFNKKFLGAKLLKYLTPSYLILLFYSVYKIYAGVPAGEKTQFDFTLASLGRIPLILLSFFNDLFLSGNWNILWFILLVSIFANRKKLMKYVPTRTFFIALLLFLGLYFINSLVTTNFEWIAGAKQGSTLPRLVLHFFPICPILIVLLNAPEKS